MSEAEPGKARTGDSVATKQWPRRRHEPGHGVRGTSPGSHPVLSGEKSGQSVHPAPLLPGEEAIGPRQQANHPRKGDSMVASNPSIFDLTAGDLMSREPVLLRPGMSLRDAARLLGSAQVSGAPVVDQDGKCVGVLSATDFLRWARGQPSAPPPVQRPLTCSFLRKLPAAQAKEVYTCTLPAEVCPFQRPQPQPDRTAVIFCSQPHCVPADWQIVAMEQLPAEEVRHYLTADPVTVQTGTSICAAARLMWDTHIHRVIVVDEFERVVGIVSSTDILAAIARHNGGPTA